MRADRLRPCSSKPAQAPADALSIHSERTAYAQHGARPNHANLILKSAIVISVAPDPDGNLRCIPAPPAAAGTAGLPCIGDRDER
ncbi:hypothetical protein BVI2075_1860002 [Burkholderia vietnamiensis]|nr:hypothetical protein BVI2075_1860002 [Burkholderia vietnamiensis]